MRVRVFKISDRLKGFSRAVLADKHGVRAAGELLAGVDAEGVTVGSG